MVRPDAAPPKAMTADAPASRHDEPTRDAPRTEAGRRFMDGLRLHPKASERNGYLRHVLAIEDEMAAAAVMTTARAIREAAEATAAVPECACGPLGGQRFWRTQGWNPDCLIHGRDIAALGAAYVECQRLLIEARAKAAPDRDALAEALHTEKSEREGGCGNHTESYDDHMEWHRGVADAILAALPPREPAPLDVERLAQVLHAIQCADAGDDACYSEDGHLEDAEHIAAEYARLEERPT